METLLKDFEHLQILNKIRKDLDNNIFIPLFTTTYEYQKINIVFEKREEASAHGHDLNEQMQELIKRFIDEKIKDTKLSIRIKMKELNISLD